VKPGPSEHLDPLEELISVVNEAQDRDATDERFFMIPSWATGRSFPNEAGLDNPLSRIRGAALYRHYVSIDVLVVTTLECGCRAAAVLKV
jgi:hypothetical protein